MISESWHRVIHSIKTMWHANRVEDVCWWVLRSLPSSLYTFRLLKLLFLLLNAQKSAIIRNFCHPEIRVFGIGKNGGDPEIAIPISALLNATINPPNFLLWCKNLPIENALRRWKISEAVIGFLSQTNLIVLFWPRIDAQNFIKIKSKLQP